VDESTLSKIINGFREPDPTLRAKIATLLATNETWLFESADGPGRPADGNSSHNL
jgi:transcriptional regulator with XRE-family HTH domain